jgi:hypothetical protein
MRWSRAVTGRPLFDAVLRRWYGTPPAMPALERHRRPTQAQWTAFRRAARPVLIDGLLEEWPNRATFTLDGLRTRFGDRRLPIMRTDAGRLRTDVEAGVSFATMRLDEYLERIARGEAMESYLATPMDAWLPELKADMPPPSYCRDAPWHNARLWISRPGTATPLHRDVAHNIFVQLAGRKRFLLDPPAAAHWLYSHDFRSALPNYSQVDAEKPDYDRFPLSHAVRPLAVELGPGDAIYLPSRWWHHVRTLDVSLSVAFWWADGAVALAVRAAEFVKRARGLEIYGLERALRDRGPAQASPARDAAA